MVNVDQATIARLKAQGQNFEILVDCNSALAVREGKEMDMHDVLAAAQIFSDAHKGLVASEHAMKQIFGTSDVDEVARQTIKCLRATVPPELPSINFLSGGQAPEEATVHLNRMHTLGEKLPWYVSFSYARALQEPALNAWQGKKENIPAAQKAFLKRAKLNSLATMGKYSKDMENE